MIKAANIVMEKGITPLKSLFQSCFPGVTYHTPNAKRRLLQMPLAALLIKINKDPKVYVMELNPGVDYEKLIDICESSNSSATSSKTFSKIDLQNLLSLAQNDRERELVRYATFKASGLTPSSARRCYGFENMTERTARVEACIEESLHIRESIRSLSEDQEAAVTQLYIDDSDIEPDCSLETATEDKCFVFDELLVALVESKFNWFHLVDHMLTKADCDDERGITNQLSQQFPKLLEKCLTSDHKMLLQQSYQAFTNYTNTHRHEAERSVDALNGFIVTGSESEDPDEYIGLKDAFSEKAKAIVAKQRKTIQRRAQYLISKTIASRNYLRKKQSDCVKTIVKEFPTIGREIEDFVKSCNVGADAWRRTGVLTFDGNIHVKSKATFGRIRDHLIKTFGRNFAYGTVVELCVARNKRRKSAERYKGLAKVTCRRARKGFMLKFNPDAHWSAAFYAGLNYLQYKDGCNIVNVNRDDAAGFRLDTMATHRLHKSPVVQDHEALTTYTDYVNPYTSILQTTSYNFTATDTTAEMCAGVVKATGVFPKNPFQHSADLEMLELTPEFKPMFFNPSTDIRKPVECFRVDGASDEGLIHEEVQFIWTERHLKRSTIACLVTARNSGSSYLNRVELQNGCLALAHANLFIPSTLGGTCMDSNTGKINKEKYEHNMELATNVYINRVNDAPCGDTVIHLYNGANSSEQQVVRKYFLQYCKGTKKQKEALKRERPELYNYFDTVWQLKERHSIKGLPPQYAFFLVCCFDPSCCHPVCRSEQKHMPPWYSGGPLITHLPLPIPDPDRPWGNVDCTECKENCTGHYLPPKSSIQSQLLPMKKPPSTVLKEKFDQLTLYPPPESLCYEIAKETLLSVSDVTIWFEHLHTIKENRRRGAVKAAETRRKNKERKTAVATYHSAVCYEEFQEFTDSVEKWIGCDLCDRWFHFVCIGIVEEPEEFVCEECK